MVALVKKDEDEVIYRPERLTEMRRKRGFSETELANRLHITQQTLSRYETGRRKPPADLLVRLAEILRTTTDYLLGLTDYPNPSGGLSDVELQLLREFRSRQLDVLHEVVNKEVAELPDSLRDVVRGIIARTLESQGKLDTRRNDP